MHHFGEDAIDVRETETGFEIVLTNHITGKRITMTVPKVGSHSDPSMAMTMAEARLIAAETAHMLRARIA